MQSAHGMIQSSRHVYHTDGLGSVAAITDSAQQTVKSYSYEAFGKIRSETGSSLTVNRYAYTAREALGDSQGFYYYRWRVMDPNAGGFSSEDPIGSADSFSLYAYAGGNPTRYSDPLGLFYMPPIQLPAPPIVDPMPYYPPIPIVPPGNYPGGARMWNCTATCYLQKIDPKCPDPKDWRVTGVGTGHTEEGACVAAKRDATQKAPRGFYARHCKCSCTQTRGDQV